MLLRTTERWPRRMMVVVPVLSEFMSPTPPTWSPSCMFVQPFHNSY